MTSWHAPGNVLALYASHPEQLDDVTATSVEAHLLACVECRAHLRATAEPAMLSSSWEAIADRIDRPRPTLAERLLRRLGVSEVNARLVGATRALQASWVLAVCGIVAAMVVIALQSGTPGLFLVVAPVIPVAAVAAAFAPGADPVGEVGGSTPMSGFGLVLRRAISVLGATVVVLGVGAAALPGLSITSAVWVLPALGLSLSALALATWVRAELAATVVGLCWLVALTFANRFEAQHTSVADLTPLAGPGQLAALIIVALAAAILAVRRESFPSLGRAL